MRMFVLTIALMNEKMLEDDRSPLFFMEDIQFFLIQFEQVKLEFRESISSICFFWFPASSWSSLQKIINQHISIKDFLASCW